MDAMTHSIEAYVSDASSPITDIHALESIRLIYQYLKPACAEPLNIEYRYQTMLGSLLAGLAFSNASLGAVHAMAHGIGGLLDLPHGECNSLLLEHVIAYNYDTCPERYDTIGMIMNIDYTGLSPSKKKEAIIEEIKKFRISLGITETLGDLGITKKDIPDLARKAIVDVCMATNPRKPTITEIEKIYETAL